MEDQVGNSQLPLPDPIDNDHFPTKEDHHSNPAAVEEPAPCTSALPAGPQNSTALSHHKPVPTNSKRTKLTKVIKASRRTFAKSATTKRRIHRTMPKKSTIFETPPIASRENDVLDNNWTKREIVITEVKLGSGTVTFTACENAEALFS